MVTSASVAPAAPCSATLSPGCNTCKRSSPHVFTTLQQADTRWATSLIDLRGGNIFTPPVRVTLSPTNSKVKRSGPDRRKRAIDPPSRLIGDRYETLAELARGGMGVVYRVTDTLTGRQVALKRCLSDSHPDLVRLLFQREYKTLASLRHPRIIEVYDYGIDDGEPFYTMELLTGEDLNTLAPLPWRRACSYLRDVATSLLVVHQRRLVHRDLSPRNVRLTSDGYCKLLDFGALTAFGIPNEIVGTPR